MDRTKVVVKPPISNDAFDASEIDARYAAPLVRRLILGFLLGGLLLLSYVILHLFLAPVAWAVILSYVTWPLYRRLRVLLGENAAGSALLMTFILTAAFVLPVLWLIVLLRGELAAAYQEVAGYLARGPHPLPQFIARIPWLGEQLQQFLDQVSGDPGALRGQAGAWAERWIGELGELIGGLGRNVLKFGFALLAVFFFYRDGERIVNQVRRVLQRFLGHRVNGYLAAVGDTTKAVVYGLVATAVAQGVLAGLGYWVVGVQAPVLLGALTALIALIPFGTPFVWGSIGVWLILTERTWGESVCCCGARWW